jgi:cytochrome c-type biogenesis protein CcmE
VPHRKFVIGALATLLLVLVALVATSINDSLTYYLTPSEAAERRPQFPDGTRFRLGGLVVVGTLTEEGGSKVFDVTDGAERITVRLTGSTPPLFAENVGVVVEGAWSGEFFAADTALIRHDENYSPPEGYAPST